MNAQSQSRTKRLEVIPAIDLLEGKIVRLFQGDFDQVTNYTEDPLELAKRYAGCGAKRLHVVDLDGAKTGDPINLPIIRSLTDVGMELQTGGGIRDVERLKSLLDAGVARGVVGSIAVEDKETVAAWMNEVGPEKIILAVDIRFGEDGEPEVLTRGWQEGSGQLLWPLVEFYLERGATEFLCTDIAKDGTLQGPNVELYKACTARYPNAEFIASGGVSNVADLYALNETGVARVVTGKALLDGRLTLEEIEQFSRDA
ncbi:MAG: 1-(5-phosphoribosyl)-5-[(5-phosphoribosylamino)methylideneamino]imidazole-4-carboxamide isomerase [Gammaproteobacteria bacterium]|nr:1-(5-phosphoribosyl)-5-[(5-phosphoribosylamino)methylideneamino]imidazole-4-carboxamide isomerase [Gammaproteobacteria bacterium]